MTGFRIANRTLCIAGVSAHLQVFKAEPSPPLLRTSGIPSKLTTKELITRATGKVAGCDREVTCRFDPETILVQIDGIAEYSVSREGSSIEVVSTTKAVPRHSVDEAILGPPLILALGLHGVMTLHAGSVATENGVVSFLGKSGSGKSTLAAYLDQHIREWLRCTDDLLPVDQGTDAAEALPHFPQLNLELTDQWRPPKPERLPLRALYILDQTSPPESRVTITTLPPTDATVTILQHSAAWTLFPPELMNRHLAFCARIAETLPVRRLSYPRRVEALPEVAAAVQTDINQLI